MKTEETATYDILALEIGGTIREVNGPYREVANIRESEFRVPVVQKNGERIVSTWNACHGLELPADVPPGILADLVAALTESLGDFEEGLNWIYEGAPQYNTHPDDHAGLKRIQGILAKLRPAGSPATVEPEAAPVSPQGPETTLEAANDAFEILRKLDAWEMDPDSFGGDLADLAHEARAILGRIDQKPEPAPRHPFGPIVGDPMDRIY